MAKSKPEAWIADATPSILFLGGDLSVAKGLLPEEGYVEGLKTKILEKGYQGRVINAAIAGEPLAGLLERLPLLMEQPVEVVVLEMGQMDEKRQLEPTLFEKQASALFTALLKQVPAHRILVLNTAAQPTYQALVENKCKDLTIKVIDLKAKPGKADKKHHLEQVHTIWPVLKNLLPPEM
ncbi:MAG TPA: hypothetical protein PKA00_19780 [Saprospiraceae bacterium]|nr:hypothetical protein [Saprospiraceae bacterium]